MWQIQLFELNYDERETRAVVDVLESGWITMGPKTEEFEAAFQQLQGGAMCTAVSSGTAALHLALLALDIGPEDEVIVPALTFVADANVVRMVGAGPVFADSESYDVWNVGVEGVRSRITPRTKAVICVHYAGYPCCMDELVALCRERNLFLVEDVSHAPGGTFGDRPLGNFGDIGAFSFFTNKNLSVGEGGMVCTGRPELHERLRLLRSHGMTTLTLDRHEGRALSYDVLLPGLNYRIDEMRAALGVVQLEKLAAANEARAALVQRYHARLRTLPEIHIPFLGYEHGRATYHIYPVLLNGGFERDAVVRALRERGIQASIHYPSFTAFSAYSDLSEEDVPIAADISRRELTLPLYPTMGVDAVDTVCDALIESLEQTRAGE